MYKISLIVPVFNAEKYLDDLFSSIVGQTIGFENIQVIFVDDFSTDESVDKIYNFASGKDNVSLIKLENNHKYAGFARNMGLKKANGKYLMFSDSDDFLMKNACEILYNEMEQKNADFITANYINADENGNVWDSPIFNTEKYPSFKLSITDYDRSFFILNSSACNKIFRKEFVDKNNICFLEGTPAEDAYFTNTCFLNSDNAYYVKEIVYAYRQRNKDNKTKSSSFFCDRMYFSCINKAYMAIYEKFKKYGKIGFYRYTYAKNVSYLLYKFIDSTLLTDEERIEVLKEMKWFYELSIELKVPACQMAQSMIIQKIDQEDYEEALNYCKVIADMRAYLPKEIKESMSRPDSDMYHIISKYDNEY